MSISNYGDAILVSKFNFCKTILHISYPCSVYNPGDFLDEQWTNEISFKESVVQAAES